MEEQLKVDVKVISRETIKPSSPTPLDKTSFNLSFVDQIFPCFHTPLLLLYNNNNNNNNNVDVISSLKASLSETLNVFYPLAGRFENESTISCNDQGVLFIETQFNCQLLSILNSVDHDLLSTLGQCLPPIEVQGAGRPITEVIPLAFQVNVFPCGSIVIGCYMIHKLLDAVSMSTFLNYWAALSTTKRCDEMLVVKPDFDATVTAFPPSPRDLFSNTSPISNSSGYEFLNHTRVIGKSFVFNKLAIENLKIKAVTEELPSPTTFEAVTAFIWHHVLTVAAIAATPNIIDISVFGFAANIRTRTCPPLPKGAMGNLVIEVCPTTQVNIDKLPQLATKINASKALKVDQKVENLQKLGLEALFENDGRPLGGVLEIGSYQLTSWCKLGLSEVDFGFGKPNRIIPIVLVHPILRNHVYLVDYIDPSSDYLGIEAWLFLEEKEMQLLECDSSFREFAFPI